MTDLALHWNASTFTGDIVLQDGALAIDDGMRTAIFLSLFTDARAPDDAELPEQGADRRGWWGNGFAADGLSSRHEEVGSLLWLLRRSKVTNATLALAKTYATAALQWLVTDRVARSVLVEVEAQGNVLAIGVTLDRPTGPARQRYDFTWDASL
ncbi:phage GP46 family protein [Sphingorhabdus sp. 109]|uniref:phage GP46 family protein n=1 Tax=Sphingorhabdus sp. 109 TaxID=2653173 RepID=UPI0012F1D4D6|nr:phage GP46 family protein [Sphingorhabdus sp. 109]VWX62610.1 conserved hypothetical protein [Sphingorhabdus sp. 109]